jgi:hypothetical protein
VIRCSSRSTNIASTPRSPCCSISGRRLHTVLNFAPEASSCQVSLRVVSGPSSRQRAHETSRLRLARASCRICCHGQPSDHWRTQDLDTRPLLSFWFLVTLSMRMFLGDHPGSRPTSAC